MEIEDMLHVFDNHTLTEVLITDNIKVFEFRNSNGDNNCYQRWIIDRGTLLVTGDNSAATYWWNNSNITLDFLAKCNLGYFMSKCIADKDGSSQEVYCQEHASTFLKNIACDEIYQNQPLSNVSIDCNIDEWENSSLTEKFDIITPIACDILEIDSYEFAMLFENEEIHMAIDFLNNNEYEFMFGMDAWEHVKGLVIPTRTPKMHLAALRVANDRFPNAF